MNAPSELVLPSLPRLGLHKFVGKEDPALLQKIGQFRVNVWRSEKKVISEIEGLDSWIGPHDLEGTHWVVTKDRAIIASARISIHRDRDHFPDSQDWSSIKNLIHTPFSSMNRLVVDRQFRRNGIAAALDRIRIEESLQKSISCIIVQIRKERIHSLEKQGFFRYESRNYQPSDNTWHYLIRYLQI